jgi:hypothetical protein
MILKTAKVLSYNNYVCPEVYNVISYILPY